MVPSLSGSNSIQHVSPNVVTPESANVEMHPVAPVPPPAGANTNAQPKVALVTPPAGANTEPQVTPMPPPAKDTNKAQPTAAVLREAPEREIANDDRPAAGICRVSTLAEIHAITKVTN